MKTVNQTLGFYTPAFFKIYIRTVQPIDPANLSNQELSTFIHEYTHFIQDFTTLYGLSNIYNIFDWLRLYVNEIYKVRKVQLPIKCSNETLEVNNLIQNISWGTPKIYNSVSAIKNVQVKPHSFTKDVLTKFPCLSGFRKVEMEIETQGQWLSIEFGSLAIMESMSHMMEQFLNPTCVTYSPDYPYNIVQILVKSLCPQLSNNNEMIFALCDIALQTSIPGVAFFEMVEQIRDNKVPIIIKCADDIYACFNRQFQPWQNFRDPQNIVYQAMDHLQTLVQGPMSVHYQQWINNMQKKAIHLRTKYPSFLLDIIRAGNVKNNKLFLDFVNDIGTPLLVNSEGFMSKIPAAINKNSTGMDVEFFQAINYIFSLLTEGDVKCPLQKWCKVSGICVDSNCIINPPAHSNITKYANFCPVGVLWYSWNLKKYTIRQPFLFRRICN